MDRSDGTVVRLGASRGAAGAAERCGRVATRIASAPDGMSLRDLVAAMRASGEDADATLAAVGMLIVSGEIDSEDGLLVTRIGWSGRTLAA